VTTPPRRGDDVRLTTVGIPLRFALVAVLEHPVFAFWIPLIPGLVLAVLLPRTGHALEAAAHEPSPTAHAAGGSGAS
jgi:hypothetical protein